MLIPPPLSVSQWNITGTILSTASEDGKIRLYKSSYAGDWTCMGTFSAEAPAERSDRTTDEAMAQE
jgi:nucleoporin SEH1